MTDLKKSENTWKSWPKNALLSPDPIFIEKRTIMHFQWILILTKNSRNIRKLFLCKICAPILQVKFFNITSNICTNIWYINQCIFIEYKSVNIRYRKICYRKTHYESPKNALWPPKKHTFLQKWGWNVILENTVAHKAVGNLILRYLKVRLNINQNFFVIFIANWT